MQQFEYITKEVADQTKYKSLVDAYQRNNIAIIKHGEGFYFETSGISNKVWDIAIRETKRIFPELKCLYDLH